jgi:predicted naringenin-chalcone synthase
MPATILGIATALPTHRIRQTDAAAIARAFSCETAEQDRMFSAIFRRSGVESRGSVVLEASDGDLPSRQSFYGESNPTTALRMERYEAAAAPLAEESARGALASARLEPRRITHVVTVSCSGFLAPGVDQALMRRLGLGADVERTHVGFMGCHGLLNGLRVARAFVEADESACVLLSAVELCSLHLQYGWNSERMVANALFADGAAAMVIAPAAQDHEPHGHGDLAIRAVGSTVFPSSEDAMSWRIGDHGFVMTLSPRVPELIGRNLRPWLSAWLARSGHSLDSVGSWAVHPGGPRILSAVGESLTLERSALAASFGVLADHGNMSSATIAFVLQRLRAAEAPRPWLAMAFGPGLAVEVALLG